MNAILLPGKDPPKTDDLAIILLHFWMTAMWENFLGICGSCLAEFQAFKVAQMLA